MLNFSGVPSSFNNATTATGSVAANIEPIVNPSPQFSSLLYHNTYFNIIAIKTTVIATPTRAKIKI